MRRGRKRRAKKRMTRTRELGLLCLAALGWLCLAGLIIGLYVGCASKGKPQEGTAEEGKAEEVKEGRMTVVFIDQSHSAVDRNATRVAQGAGEPAGRGQSVLEDSLYGILGRRLDRAGDRVELFAINAKTQSKAFRVRHRNNAPRPEPRAFEDEQALEAIRYRQDARQEVERAQRRTEQFLRAMQHEQEFRGWTDVWGSLFVAADMIRQGPDRAPTVVYLLSDMYESMEGPMRRNFEWRPPQSRAEAKAWAIEDVERMCEQFGCGKDPSSWLRRADIRVIIGRHGVKEKSNAVEWYWRTVLETLGARSITYNA